MSSTDLFRERVAATLREAVARLGLQGAANVAVAAVRYQAALDAALLDCLPNDHLTLSSQQKTEDMDRTEFCSPWCDVHADSDLCNGLRHAILLDMLPPLQQQNCPAGTVMQPLHLLEALLLPKSPSKTNQNAILLPMCMLPSPVIVSVATSLAAAYARRKPLLQGSATHCCYFPSLGHWLRAMYFCGGSTVANDASNVRSVKCLQELQCPEYGEISTNISVKSPKHLLWDIGISTDVLQMLMMFNTELISSADQRGVAKAVRAFQSALADNGQTGVSLFKIASQRFLLAAASVAVRNFEQMLRMPPPILEGSTFLTVPRSLLRALSGSMHTMQLFGSKFEETRHTVSLQAEEVSQSGETNDLLNFIPYLYRQ